MATNERVTNRGAATERYIGDADPYNISEPPTDGGCLCSDPILLIVFSVHDSISTWYSLTSMIQKRLD